MVTPDEILTIPRKRSGVYHLIRNGRVLYVGQSANLLCRLGAHDWTGYDEARFFYCDPSELNDLERAHIEALRPPLNREGITREYRGVRDREITKPRLINAVERLREARREVRAIQNGGAI